MPAKPCCAPGQAQRSRLRWLLPFLRGNTAVAAGGRRRRCHSARTRFGLIWSNLMLHWLDDPLPAFREMHRVLAVGGLLMFSTFGPDTLKELRACFSDGSSTRSVSSTCTTTATCSSNAVCRSGDGCRNADHDLRRRSTTCSPTCAATGRAAPCRPPARADGAQGMAGRARSLRETAQGRPFAGDCSRVVYGHAWKAQPKKTADGRTIVRFEPRQRSR
jgi:malonyl-CoA O-methyltransferase